MRVLLVCLLLAAAPAAAQLNVTDPPGEQGDQPGEQGSDQGADRDDPGGGDGDAPSGLVAFVLVMAIVAILAAIVVARRRR